MAIEAFPNLTAQAAELWAAIPADIRKRQLSSVWCGKCRHEVTITKFTGTVKTGGLLLVGKCSDCRGDVAKLVDMN